MKTFLILFIFCFALINISCSKKALYGNKDEYFYTKDKYYKFPITYKPKYTTCKKEIKK